MKLILAFSLMLLAVGFVMCPRKAEPQEIETRSIDEQVNQLLVKRRDTMRTILDLATKNQKTGHGDLREVFIARRSLLNAELQLVNDKEKRIHIHEELLENARSWETVIKQRHEAGDAGTRQLLLSRAASLQAEIELLKERSVK